jgi:cobaltochelatase CobN
MVTSALECTATVDYLFGFDATAGIMEDWMYEEVAQHYALDPTMREFFQESNPWALNAVAERLLEAAQRKMWNVPNPDVLDALKQTYLESETALEERGETARREVVPR